MNKNFEILLLLIIIVVGGGQTVEAYMEAFGKSDHPGVLSTLADDVVWDLPGAFHLTGKVAFDHEIENPAFTGRPTIQVTRMTEENNVVVAEGTVQSAHKNGKPLHLAFCDVFELKNAKITHLTSYLIGSKSIHN